MQRLRVAALVFSFLIFAPVPFAATAATIIDFEGYPPFSSPGSAIPGIVVSLEGGILNEAAVTAVTGLSFPAGTVATSGTNVLGNVYGSNLTIIFTTPAIEFSVQTVGSVAAQAVGTITVTAYDGASAIGSDSSDPTLFGDSGVPEDSLGVTYAPGITSIVFSSDIGGASSFLIDDLNFTVPEPTTLALLGLGLVVLGLGRSRSTPRFKY